MKRLREVEIAFGKLELEHSEFAGSVDTLKRRRNKMRRHKGKLRRMFKI